MHMSKVKNKLESTYVCMMDNYHLASYAGYCLHNGTNRNIHYTTMHTLSSLFNAKVVCVATDRIKSKQNM